MSSSFMNGFLDGLALRPVWRFLAARDIQAAVLAEREACAKVCDEFDFYQRLDVSPPRTLPKCCAAAIRNR